MLAALKRLYRNTLFRLSLLGAVLFVVSLLISLGYVYYATISSELRDVDKTLIEETRNLQALYDKEGVISVNREIIMRASSNERLYLLQTGPNSMAGNLGPTIISQEDVELFGLLQAPDQTQRPFSLIKFKYSVPNTEIDDLKNRRVRALAGYVFDSDRPVAGLIIGRDVETIMRTSDRVTRAMYISSILALVLGLISSWFVSGRFTRRIEEFNHLATDVRAGNLDRRATRNYSEDELDLLAEHLNAMLDHIDRLMKAMRYAGDSIAHDLRSPLTRLRTRLESAAVETANAGASDTLYAAAEDAGELLKTFDSVLRIARLEAGERRELLKDVDLKPVLADIAELYEPACEEENLSFTTNIEGNLLIRVDRGLLSQAVSNLVENAIKYTPSGGQIALKLERNKSGRVEISVTDSGPGIPEADRERVKERFVRLDKSRSQPGSGLGLSLVEAIADLHRAEFLLTEGILSEHGKGLSAKLIFPRRRKS